MGAAGRKTKVLIIDDSPAARQLLRETLASDPAIEVMGTAPDPFVAAEKMKQEAPDVITLDVGMPRMDGITFLEKIMTQHPMPVVICSTSEELDEATVRKARLLGAADVVEMPAHGGNGTDKGTRERICNAVKAASPVRHRQAHADLLAAAPKLPADVILPPARAHAVIPATERIVVVGASTGGTEALRVFLEGMPEDSPPIVIAQHMPGQFTPAFAGRLDSLCRISVKEARDGDAVIRGRALIAPGDRHTLLTRNGVHYFVEVRDGPPVSRHRPSVDVLFRSAAVAAGRNAVGVIMTGMGDDGARGMKEMKDAGAYTIAQDERSCVVFGMPAEAIRRGGVTVVRTLETIGSAVIVECTREVPIVT